MAIWAPGMRCVCVEGSANTAVLDSYGIGYPRKGDVLTVKDGWVSSTGALCLAFAEHDNSHVSHMCEDEREPGFPARRFRPLSETRLDQFRQHLNRIPADEVLA